MNDERRRQADTDFSLILSKLGDMEEKHQDRHVETVTRLTSIETKITRTDLDLASVKKQCDDHDDVIKKHDIPTLAKQCDKHDDLLQNAKGAAWLAGVINVGGFVAMFSWVKSHLGIK